MEAEVRWWQEGRCVESYHAVLADADGNGEVQEKNVAGGAGCKEWV